MAKKEQKSIQKNFRITMKHQEFVSRQCKRYGIRESEYFRRLIDADSGKKVNERTQEEYHYRKQLLYEIGKIGTNINQIVKNVNSHYYTDYEKKKLFALMKKVTELVEKL